MPVDREKWRKEINLSNFINAAYQHRDLKTLGSLRRLLVIGVGQGLDSAVLRWLGYDVTTMDIDPLFEPDHVGSTHDLSRFDDGGFDAVIASHVLEHLPVHYLDASLSEIARVGRYALVYLPVAGRHVHARLAAGSHELFFAAELFNYFERPDGNSARYMSGQHFWEMGYRGFRKKDLLARFARDFDVLDHYRNRDWLVSYNFVLRSKRHPR